MSYSEDWDSIYKNSKHLSIWPWSDLVSYVKRYTNIDKDSNVLELGCGAGANIPFILSITNNYYAIEGSESIVSNLIEKYPLLSENIKVGDFTKELNFNQHFNLIFDRASLTHNTTESIRNSIELIKSKMLRNSFFIGIDWFSTEHSSYTENVSIVDKYTRNGFKTGTFNGVGNVHFFDKEHILDILNGFDILILEHKSNNMIIPNNNRFASWNFVAKKI